jgi:hypothetical protein
LSVEQMQIALAALAIVAAMVGGVWAVLVFAGKQYDAKLDVRFENQEKLRIEGRKAYEDRLAQVEKNLRDSDHRFLKFLADLPREYMRREDHIRFETVITAKLDSLNAEIRLLAERASKGA